MFEAILIFLGLSSPVPTAAPVGQPTPYEMNIPEKKQVNPG